MFVTDITTEIGGHTMDHSEMRSNLSIAEMTSEQGRQWAMRHTAWRQPERETKALVGL